MAVYRYLTGRSRTVKHVGTLACEARLTYGPTTYYHLAGQPDALPTFDAWYCDYSRVIGVVEPVISPLRWVEPHPATYPEGWSAEFDYGFRVSHNDNANAALVTWTYIWVGTVIVPPHTPGAGPFLNGDGEWFQAAWSGTGTIDFQWPRREYTNGSGSEFREELPPGSTVSRLVTFQGANVQWGAVAYTGDSFDAYKLAGKVVADSRQGYWGSGINQGGNDDTYYTLGPQFAQGCQATFGHTFDAPGLTNPAGSGISQDGCSATRGPENSALAGKPPLRATGVLNRRTTRASVDHTGYPRTQFSVDGRICTLDGSALAATQAQTVIVGNGAGSGFGATLTGVTGDFGPSVVPGLVSPSGVTYGADYVLQCGLSRFDEPTPLAASSALGGGWPEFFPGVQLSLDTVSTVQETSATRALSFRYLRFPALTLAQSPRTVFEQGPFTIAADPISPGTNWSGFDVTLTAQTDVAANDVLQFVTGATVSNGTGPDPYTFARRILLPASTSPNTALVSLGYRRIAVEIRSVGSANKSFRLQLEGLVGGRVNVAYAANLTTGAAGVWVTRYMDVIEQDAGSGAEAGILTEEGRFTAWLFRGLAASTTYQVRLIAGERQYESLATALTNDLGNVLYGLTDGWPSLLLAHSASGIGAPNVPTVAALVAYQAAGKRKLNGWTLTAAQPRRADFPTGAGTYYVPLSDLSDADNTLSTELFGGGMMADYSFLHDATVATGGVGAAGASDTLTVDAAKVNLSLSVYPGAGDVLSANGAGLYGATVPVPFLKFIGGAIQGAIIGNPKGTARIRSNVTNALRGQGMGRVGSGAFATGAPFAEGGVTHTFSGVAAGSGSTNVNIRQRTRRSAYLWLPPQVGAGAIETDKERGYLLVANEKRVRVYFLPLSGAVPILASESADHPVTGWLRFLRAARSGTLMMLGTAAGGLLKLYTSGDLGESITEVLSVTALSGAVEHSEHRGLWAFLYEDASNNLQRRESYDGATWAAATAPTQEPGAVALTGKVLDMTRDRERDALFMTLDSTAQGGTVRVLRSGDLGKTWAVTLS